MKAWSESRGHRRLPKHWVESGNSEYDFRKLTEEEQEEVGYYHTQKMKELNREKEAQPSIQKYSDSNNHIPQSTDDLIHQDHLSIETPILGHNDRSAILLHESSSNFDHTSNNGHLSIHSLDHFSKPLDGNIFSSVSNGNLLLSPRNLDSDRENDDDVGSIEKDGGFTLENDIDDDDPPRKKSRRGRPAKDEPAKPFSKPSDITSRRSRLQMYALSKSIARRNTQMNDVEIDVGGVSKFCSRLLMVELTTIKDPPYSGGSFLKGQIRHKPLLRIVGGKDKDEVISILAQCLHSLSADPGYEDFENVLLHDEEQVKVHFQDENEKRRSEAFRNDQSLRPNVMSSRFLDSLPQLESMMNSGSYVNSMGSNTS